MLSRYAVPSINVQAFAVDVANEEQLSEFLQKVRSGQLGNFPPKIGGIMHAAMVLRDKQLSETTPQDLHEVMAPKATGAIIYDQSSLRLSSQHCSALHCWRDICSAAKAS